MKRFLIKLLLLFVPVSSWRKAMRARLGHALERPKIQRRFNKIADWKFRKVDGINVADGVLPNGKCISLANINGIDRTPEFVAHEVFQEMLYHFSPKENTVVIDIGMNHGYASLYFAMRDDVEAVYAFEPLSDIYEKAVLGFSLNKCAQKIHPFNFGLGDSNRTEKGYYSEQHTGRFSMMNPKKSGIPIEIQIKDAATEISDIIAKHPDTRIVVKCDCEGAEKEIFARLDAENILPTIDTIIMEYHYSLDKFIMSILDKNRFVYFSTGSHEVGIIRAVSIIGK